MSNYRTRFFFFTVLAIVLAIGLGACQPPQPVVSPLSPVTTPVGGSDSPEKLIPAGHVQVGESFASDFDQDGVTEVAVAYTAAGEAGGGGILVAKPKEAGYIIFWQVEVPKDTRVTEFKTRDMLDNQQFTLLIFSQVVNTTRFPLYVYRWVDGQFQLIGPHGGKLDGQSTFTSDYWPTTLGDVDDDKIMEIVPTIEFDPPVDYLEPLVYQWDGKQYTFTNYYILPPRFKPGK